MKLSRNAILFLIAVAIGVAGIDALVFAEAARQRAVLSRQIAAKQSAIDQMRAATAGYESVRARIVELRRAVGVVESRLAPERDLDKILRDICQMADANCLQTRAIQPLAIEHRGNYSEQPVELTLTGDFNGFYAFLLQLERLPRLMRITDMDLQRLAETNGSMRACITVSIFFQPDTGQTASADSP